MLSFSEEQIFASFREEKIISIVSLCQEQLTERVNNSLAEFGSPPLPVLFGFPSALWGLRRGFSGFSLLHGHSPPALPLALALRGPSVLAHVSSETTPSKANPS